MTYLVTARKWRPLVFEDIVGQSHVAKTLRNAIATNRLSHAYMFSGPRGVGKTTAARILAKAINCLHPVDFNPDNTCELCTELAEGRSLNVFEIDGASNRGVEEIRNLREAVRYGPAKGAYKVYIIDEVHMLTKEAFNALLKTLEEPPSYIVFIFATTEIHKVPPTILSRCQRFDFRRISTAEIIGRLRFIASQEHITVDDDALFVAAKRSDGSMRDAQSIFDQIVSFCGEKVDTKDVIRMLNAVDEEIYFRVTDSIRTKDAAAGLALVEEIMTRGYDIREFLAGLMEHLRNLLVTGTTGSAQLVEASDVYRKRYLEDSKTFAAPDLLRLIRLASDTDAAIRWNQSTSGGRFKLEIGLLQMIRLDGSVQIAELLRQLDELKKKPAAELSAARTAAPQHPVPPAAGAPIRGTVQASQPKLRPEQVVPPTLSATGEMHVFQGQTASVAPAPVAAPLSIGGEHSTASLPLADEQAGVRISIDEAHAKWPDLIAEVSRKRILVGTMLSEASLVGVGSDTLRVSCPDDFHLDQLARNRQFIADLAQNIYGARVRLETILAKAQSQASAPQGADASPLPVPVPGGAAEQASSSAPHAHPVIQALIREFGAKEV